MEGLGTVGVFRREKRNLSITDISDLPSRELDTRKKPTRGHSTRSPAPKPPSGAPGKFQDWGAFSSGAQKGSTVENSSGFPKKMSPTSPPKLLMSTSEYANGLMIYSEMPGFAQMARTQGKLRRFKITIFTLCTLGFLYQTIEYAFLYRGYPVILATEIEYPEAILHPSFTYCFHNSISVKKFCGKYPERCDNDWPRDEFKDNRKWMTRQDYRELAIGFDETFRINEVTHLVLPITREEDIIRMPIPDESGKWLDCIVVNHQILSLKEDPLTLPTFPNSIFGMVLVSSKMLLVHYSSDIFTNATEDDIMVIHSPYEMADPVKEGAINKRAIINQYLVSYREYHRLPPPYVTGCRDYFEDWKTMGKKGPLSRKTCIEECKFKAIFENCGCFLVGILYPNDEEFCRNEKIHCAANISVDHCYESCPKECFQVGYKYMDIKRDASASMSLWMKFLEMFSRNFDIDITFIRHKNEVKGFGLGLGSPEKLIYRYIPKYSLIESFSYIGGYLGIWLGISLSSLFDLLTSLAKIFHYHYFKKKPTT